MRSKVFLTSLLLVILCSCSAGICLAQERDYDRRFVRDYPPGFYSMYWKAERFYEPIDKESRETLTTEKLTPPPAELYSWDKRMAQVTGINYPFYPTPFPWDYGTGRTFNLPNYNSNNWAP